MKDNFGVVFELDTLDGESHYFYQTHFDYFLNEYGGGSTFTFLKKYCISYHLLFYIALFSV